MIGKVHQALLTWYSQHGRDLPWRRTRDPYAILVSEVMLQQTQVERVIPKYHDFLSRFPTLEALAAASRAEVIRAWSPLGYNLRAVRLHEIAQQAVRECGGRLPSDEASLLRLKGLGPYTAAALRCFAFDEPTAAVDTNVRRVLARVLLGEPDGRQLPPREVMGLAERALPRERAYDWNQALMDLGATICLARRPACQRCPLERLCLARPAMDSRPANGALRERRASYRAAPTYTSTRRYFRGRIVQVLRRVTDQRGLDLGRLGAEIKPNFRPNDLPWLLELVRRLERDGLVRLIDDPGIGEGIPPSTMVALG